MNALSPNLEPAQERSFDVTEADFETTVLDRSMQVPVLLDCWAPWCGPCRSLKPVLEKLARDYDGRFVLAKLNTDEAPQIAAALNMRSIPLVLLFINGQPVDQFVGALPESQVRQFLDQHLPLEVLEEVPLGLVDEADVIEADGNVDAAPPPYVPTTPRPPGDAAALAARVAANGKDFEARFGLADILAWQGEFREAFEQLLDVVLRDKAEHRERARQQLVAWFEVCPDPAVVSQGRRFLGMYLN